ncbi:MAG: trigger factor [Oscillospiraceae bacterium]|nr:trigger factor [Oscillospiraceae bacterium]
MSFTYKGLSAQLDKHTVTDAEIDHQMQRLLQQTPRITEVGGRPTQTGDEIVLDYAGFCGDEQFAGGTAENQTLVLGSGMFIPGFEEQLVGKDVGDEVTVKVTFPEAYHSEALAGKEARFECKIHQIRTKGTYELDDTFAKEVGGCETYEEMHRKLGESLQAYSDERGEMDLQDRLLRQAADTLELTITDEQMEAAVEDQMNNLKSQLAQQGLNLEMYCSFMSTTVEELRAEARPAAESAIRSQAAIDRIVELENLTADENEINDALAIIARQNNMTSEQLKPCIDEEFEKAVTNSVLTGKVMALIREHAHVTVV